MPDAQPASTSVADAARTLPHWLWEPQPRVVRPTIGWIQRCFRQSNKHCIDPMLLSWPVGDLPNRSFQMAVESSAYSASPI